MKLSVLLSIATALVASADALFWERPKVEDAARIARTLINRESLANLNTIHQAGDHTGSPTSFVEYYADCGENGNPTFLAVEMGTSFKNIEDGSPVTLTVRTGDHAFNEHVNPKYPGSRPNSVAGSPRINLRGSFKTVDAVSPEVEKCFLARHRDAAWWLPGNPIHKTHWAVFEVESMYFLGGFGDTGYIGEIPLDLYQNAELLDEKDAEGNNLSVETIGDDSIEDWAFKAYMAKHELMDVGAGIYAQIDAQYAAVQAFLNGDEQTEDVVLDLPQEPSSILDIFHSQFDKRDIHHAGAYKFHLKDCSREKLTTLLDDLNALKFKVAEYGAHLMTKEDQQKVHHRYSKDPHHKVDPHHKFNGDAHHKFDREDPHHSAKKFHKEDPHHSGKEFQKEEKFHKFDKEDPHHSAKKFHKEDPHHSGKEFQKEEKFHKFDKEDPHHSAKKVHKEDPHHSGKEFHKEEKFHKFDKEDPHHSAKKFHKEDPHHANVKVSKDAIKVQGVKNTYRIVESSHANPGFYSASELYLAHHQGEELPEDFVEEMVIVVPVDEEVVEENENPLLVNQAALAH